MDLKQYFKKNIMRNFRLIFPFMFLFCSNENREITHKSTYLNGNLQKIYYTKLDTTHQFYHMDYLDTNHYYISEKWIMKNKGIISKGFYREGLPYEGKFIIADEAPKCTTFHIEEYHAGELHSTEYPDWNTNYDFCNPIIDFAFQTNSSNIYIDSTGQFINYSCDFGYFGVHHSRFMKILNEKLFSDWVNSNGIHEGYRVVISPSFARVIIFKIIFYSDSLKPCINIKVSNGVGGYNLSITKKEIDTTFDISNDFAQQLLFAISKTNLWSTTHEYKYMCCDGTTYYFEGIKNNLYMYKYYNCRFPKPLHDFVQLLLIKFSDNFPNIAKRDSTNWK